MSEQMKKQIIKAHIYGHSVEEIAECECITVSEVEEALADTKLIEETKSFMLEMGWMQG